MDLVARMRKTVMQYAIKPAATPTNEDSQWLRSHWIVPEITMFSLMIFCFFVYVKFR